MGDKTGHGGYGPTADGRQLPTEAALLLLFEGLETTKKDAVWFALNDDRRLAAFAGKLKMNNERGRQLGGLNPSKCALRTAGIQTYG
ncbi:MULTISPECIES: hypothetical protein [unclassified Bradyrhizobium]|uniref:hypothetical protein n=1 Tax=unclassified Bradyrhizobium TaxID=2631580 RepID=UPI002FF41A81